MKHRITLLMALVGAMLFSQSAWAQDYDGSVTLDDGITIYYHFQGDRITICAPANETWNGFNMPVGDLVIPASITHQGVSYPVTEIEPKAFQNCIDITSVIIPNSVNYISYNAFFECSGITSLTIGSSVIDISNGAFAFCSALEEIHFRSANPPTLNGIAFLDHNDVPVYVPCGSLLNYSGWGGFTDIRGESEKVKIGSLWYLLDCANHSATVVPELSVPQQITSPLYSNHSCPSGDITIPASVGYGNQTFAVTAIGDGAFAYCQNITSVDIPESVTSIGNSAFRSCDVMESLTIGNSVTSIGNKAFGYCLSLESVNIPNSVISIGNNAFEHCYSLTSVTIGNSVTTIGNEAFIACVGLSSLTIGNSVTSIGNKSFFGCNNLTSLTIGNSVTSIGNEAFSGCNHLTEVHLLASNPPSLGSNVFIGVPHNIPLYVPCGTLSAYQVSDNWGNLAGQLAEAASCSHTVTVTSNNDQWGTVSGGDTYPHGTEVTLTATPACFHSFVRWTDVDGNNVSTENPLAVTVVSDTALTAVFKATDTVLINGLWYRLNQTNHTATVVPETKNNPYYVNSPKPTGELFIPSLVSYCGNDYTVTKIGANAFFNCTGLTGNVTIPNTVTSISEYAFFYCTGITSLTIGSAVSSIDVLAFRFCTRLQSIVVESATPPTLGANAFANCPTGIPVTVPCNSLAAYQTANRWSSFTHIQEASTCTHTVTVTVDDLSMGTIEGDGTYTVGENVTLTATPNCGYRFVHWTSNSTPVSTDNSISFNVTQDTALTALFEAVATTGIQQECSSGQTLIYSIDCSNLTATLTGHGDNCTGTLAIPESIIVNGIEFSVTAIGEQAFKDCSGLTGTLTIPSSVTTIGDGAFQGCSGFTGTLTIPSSVTSIGTWAFSSCSGFTGIVVENGNPQYDSRNNCNAIINASNTLVAGCQNTVIPNTVTTIGDGAFKGCTTLTSVTIPTSVTRIDFWAFSGCTGLTTLTIPGSVTNLGNYAFAFCGNLTEITSLAEEPPVANADVFLDSPKTIPVKVPCGKVSPYRNAAGWSNFNNIQEASTCPRTVTVDINDPSMGTVEGNEGTYIDGATVTLTATPNCGYRFVHWTSNSTPVSTDNSISFNVTQDTALTALFEAVATTGIQQECSSGQTLIYSIDCSNLTATLTGHGDNCTGTLAIPESIIVNGIEFSVTAIGRDAFKDCSGLTGALTIPNSITTIGIQAFRDCHNITTVTLSNSLTELGRYAFSFCYNLGSIVIPSSLTELSGNTFYECRSITSLHIPATLTSISQDFDRCSGLTTITVDADNPVYDSRNNCNAIIKTTTNTLVQGCQTTVIPTSVTAIGASAFDGQTNLTSIEIPSSVTTIGEYAFSGSGLTSMIIPQSVTSIGHSAFYYCLSMQSVVIPNTIDELEFMLFDDCRSLQSITCMAENPPAVSWSTFIEVPSTAVINVPCGKVSAYRNVDGWSDFDNIQEVVGCPRTVTVDIDDPSMGTVEGNEGTYIDGSTVTLTATPNCGYRFVQWTSNSTPVSTDNPVSFIVTKDTALTAEFEALSSTTGIEQVCSTGQTLVYNLNCPEGTATLTGYTGTCTGDLVIPDHITVGGVDYPVDTIAYGAFSSDWNPEATLSSVVIPNSVTYIGVAFFNMPLTSVHIGSGVSNIENGAFDFCEHITSIVVDPANTTYDSRDNCNALIKTSTNEIIRGCNTTTLPSTVTSIGDNAFSHCSVNLSTIPENIMFIRRGAFLNCTFSSSTLYLECGGDIMEEAFHYANGFSSVVISENVLGIDGSAFAGCDDLASITVAQGNPNYDSRNNCNAVIHTTDDILILGCKNTVIPEEVTEIGYSAFRQHHTLTSIVIPNNVTTIHAEAFYYDGGLQSITFGSGLSEIEGYSFVNCEALESITLLSETPPTLNDNVFHTGNPSEYDFRPNCTLFVPCGKVSAYQNAAGWSDFENIQEMDGCTHTVTATSADETMGTVSGGGTYTVGSTATLAATANVGYHFVQWNDGNHDSPRSLTVTQDTTLTASFAPTTVYTTVDTSVCNNKFPFIWNGLTVTGAGSETATLQNHLGADSIVTINVHLKYTSAGDTTAVEFDQFSWYGHTYYQSTDTPTHLLTNAAGCDSTVTLHLTINPSHVGVFEITATADDATKGTVSGGGRYDAGEEVTLKASANCGYQFKQWTDGSTDNPRTVSVAGNASYTAEFEQANYTFETPSGQMLNYAVDCETQTACVTGYTGVCRGLLVIPPLIRIEGVIYVVVSIGPSAFENNTGLLRVMIPGTVDAIYESAFKGCTNLAKVEGWYQLKGLE